MKEIFILIRFPVFLIGLGVIILYSIPLAFIGFCIVPITSGISWLWYLVTSPIVLVWCALNDDQTTMKEHWAKVEAGLGIADSYEGIGNWFLRQYRSIYEWLIGD